MIDTIDELDASLAIVTETWLADGETLEEDKQDLVLGAGISLICKNRPRNLNGQAYGGVALFFKSDLCSFKEIHFNNPDSFEIVVAAGSIRGHTRKVVAVGCYIPPNYATARGKACLDYIYNLVIEVKRRYKDPYIIVSVDFNQWDAAYALEEFRDIKESESGPTRGTSRIDRTFTNFESVNKTGILEPLRTEESSGHVRHSDHKIFFMNARLKRKERYRWLTYSYRYNNEISAAKFGEWLTAKDWADVVQAKGSNNKANLYQKQILNAIEQFFPLRTIKRRNIDPPWINEKIRRLIKARKRIFVDTGGRTPEWKRMKKKTDKLIEKRRKIYQESQKIALLAEDADRNFFKQTKNYMTKERKAPFDVRDLFPGRTESQVADILAEHFNAISCEFKQLENDEIPKTYSKAVPELPIHEVALRQKKFRKPKSVVKGDIFPNLVTKYADFLAVPLTSIYNEISATKIWPDVWKEERVTVIPKCGIPTEVGQLRNISCTMLASKVYESYVLNWALSQVKLKENQFGGSKGCGTSHLLISVWQNILEDLEDCRAATLLTAIDYAKAFNRMSFQECLNAFARHGASSEIIALVATFLTGRTMSVRVGNEWSRPRAVHGGVPQGSILGVLLFNITTDNLEDEVNATGFNGTTQPRDNNGDAPLRAAEQLLEESMDEESNDDLSSTPIGEEVDFEPGVTPFRQGSSQFVFLSKARNVRRSLFDPDRTLLRDRTLPLEHSRKTAAVWKDRPTSKHKYVDDGILDTKLNMENTVATTDMSGKVTRDKHALSCQNLFRRVIYNAESIGMKVNSSKTNMLCISDAMSFSAQAHIFSMQGERLNSSQSLKLLGFHFGERPTVQEHVAAVRRKFRGRYWLLIHLGKNGFTESELLKAYTTIVRPIAEYCAPVFHSMLNDRQDEELEKLQATALKYIYGFGPSYAQLREISGLKTLRQRRIEL